MGSKASLIQDIYSLTPLQEGMLFYHMMDSSSGNYIIQSTFKLNFNLNEEKFKQALKLLSAKYDVLRTTIIYEKMKVPKQVVFKQKEIEFKIYDLTSYSEKEAESISDQYIADEMKKGFNLQKDTLIRFMYCKMPGSYSKITYIVHHIIIDGWSNNILNEKLMEYYGSLINGMTYEDMLEQIKAERRSQGDYKDYINWIQKNKVENAMQYWNELLADFDGSCEIKPLGKLSVGAKKNMTVKKSLPIEKSDKLFELSHELNITPNTFFRTAVGRLLHIYTGKNDTIVDSIVSGRNADISGISNMVGLFLNTVPIRIKADENMTVRELLNQQQLQGIESTNYDFCSLAEIYSNINQFDSENKILYVYENYSSGKEQTNDTTNFLDMEMELDSDEEQTSYDINIIFSSGRGINVKIMYSAEKYNEYEIDLLASRLLNVLANIIDNIDKKVSEISCETESAQQRVLYDFNATETEYPRDKTVVELFEEQAEKTPDNIALVFEDTSLTYAELNARANSLAYKLRELGVKPDDFVAVIADKSLEIIAGIYGIIKAGGAYVPIDPTYPEERIRFMLEDCKPKALLKYTEESITVPEEIPVIDLRSKEVWEGASENPEHVNKPNDLIYCIYTSGTTGKPKGSIIENKSVVRLVKKTNYIELDEHTVILQTGSMSFDASTLEVWGAFLNGGKLVITVQEVITDNVKLRELINKEKVNTMWLTSTLFNQMISEENDIFDGLEHLLIGGEKLSDDHVRIMKNRNNGVKLTNGYGPTENTTFTTTYEIPAGFEMIPIGKPIANTKVYIFNGNDLCGIGIPGELCIAGDGVARGYLNRPELTAEKFVKNPFGEGKMYRSGDLARWLPDGNIEYLGRIDEQVKIRGFRIELGEIESRIREIENIKDCAVIARTDASGDKAIYAYYTSEEEVSLSEIRDRLGEALPNYMIPAYMTQIEKIPVTRNGKLDKRALPEIEARAAREYAAPRNEIEEKICDIFKEILNVEQVGIKDSFFELGGHSLRATRLVNRIEAETGTRIALKEVFSHPAPEQLAVLASTETEEYIPIPKAEKKEYYAMSSTQKRTYLIQQMEPESMAYNMPFITKMTGEVYPEKLKEALQKMIDRHEILRTAFLTVEGEPVQKILETAEAEFEYTESTESDEKLAEEYFRAFDLSRPPFVRVKLVNKGEYCLFMLDMHHIVSDGMSENIFVSELTALYRGEELEPPTRQYRDYSEWMRTRDLSGQAEYWKSQFEDEIPALDMPLDYARPQIQSYEGARIISITDEKVSSEIKKLSKQTGATEYMIFLAALMVTLSKYSRQEDIVIGSPISGRTHRDTEGMLGMFVNTLAMRGRPEGNKTFEEFLNEIREISLNAYENQEYPFEELVEAVDVRRDMSRNPLFDVLMVMQNNEEANADLENVDLDAANAETEAVAKFDMTFSILPLGDRFGMSLEYCTAIYRKETAERILSHFNEVLKAVTADRTQKLNKIEMLTEEERRRILNDFNDTAAEYPRDKTVVELFEEQAEKTPNNIALMFENTSLTYAELNSRANSLAYKLRKLGVKPDDFVAIIADRSIEMIAGIYGIIKAGGAYVPIDPTYPEDRIRFMLEDCKPKAALKYTEESINIPEEIPVIDLRNKEVWEGASENPEHVNKPNDLIYCIYTSGTTGKPKGVLNRHKGIVNLINWMQSEYPLSETDVILQKTTYVFDVSVSEIFWWLKAGAKLAILKKNAEKEPEEIAGEIEKYGVTVIDFVPSMLSVFMTMPEKYIKQICSLKYVLAAGEALNAELVKIFYQTMKKYGSAAVLENIYGPTEASVYSTYYNLAPDFDGETVLIGRPVANAQAYIVNNTKLCGIGVPGELCIAGDGVARGYLNRPELTAEKFVKNPFGEGKMYRSGDLARWLPDGNIEYLGRIDEQVKIRGFRIELGEIESKIREIENIKDCAVIARTDASGDKAIYAYYTSEEEVSVSEIRDRLGEALPNYMIPAYMTQIEEIPVTRNGKLDRRALPEIEAQTGNEYAAPETETQKIICEIFCEILNAEKVGIKDGFFELGGHSLRATRLANSIEEKTGVKIALRDIFVHATPEQLAEIVDNRAGEAYEPIPKAEEKEYYAMSSAQKRTYLIQQLEPESMAYNMPFIMKMTGEVYPEKLKEALQKMIDRHEILRTAFLTVEGEPVQKILETAEAEFEYTESTESDEKLAEEYFRAFDLRKPPFVRVKLVNKGEYCLFMLDMHHIVSDGMSENIFISELTALYRGEELEPPTRQYRDYSEWMRTRDLSGQAEYWKSQFEDEIPALDMPLDYARPQIQSYEGASVSMLTDEEVSSGIKNIAEKTGATEYMIFLAALMVTLSKYSRQEDIVIGSPISGRTHRDTEGMLGMFVNTLAMRGRPEGNKTFEEFLNEIREISLNAYENQEYPFEELVEAVDVRRDMSRNPIFDVMLTMQNNEEANADLENVDMDRADAETESVAKFDMTFSILPLGGRFGMSLEYCTAIYRKDTAERILSHFNEVLREAAEDMTVKLADICMITETEQKMVLTEFNATEAEYPRDKTVVDLFEEQVEKTPDNIALVFENTSLTYAELNEKANALAHKLREVEVKPDDFVAIIADRSIEMIAGIYGIIKAGGAYVPIDPTYPEERINFILEDCKPKAVLKYTEESINIPEEIPVIDLRNKEVWEGAPENPEHVNKPNDLIYCIYTSGTTGIPKGVIVNNSGVVSLCVSISEKYGFCVGKRVLQMTNITFDPFVEQLFSTHISGAALVEVNSLEQKAVDELYNCINANNVTIANFPLIILRELINYLNNGTTLKTIICGGEKLDDQLKDSVIKCGIDLYNHYGPTETIVDATTSKCTIDKISNIGKPLPNKQVYIMNGKVMCGIGIPGELCIAGDGLARGYLNRPELTAEKFVKNPFGEGKMYRSGDLARWLPDGNIEYLGRIDEQVKIRGFRIELGEIESRIREIENIKDCAVIARTDASGDKAIYAYYTSDSEVSVSKIRDRLGEALPNYMIPAYMTQIEEIPVTRNGKLDKRALPEIEARTGNEYAASETETQAIICEIFGEILGAERVGIKDGFFELGGHSLRATRLANSIEEKTGVKIALRDIFVHATPEQLAEIVDGRAGEAYEPIPKAEEKEYYAMSSAQKRTYLIQQLEPESMAYNMPFIMKMTGEVYPEKLREALQKMIDRHEILRTAFLTVEGEPVQKILETAEAEFEYTESTESDEKLAEEYFRAFDLSRPPFVRVKLVNKGEYCLFILDMHHIVSDGMSENIFVSELTALYRGEELEPLNRQYRDYSEWMRTRDLSGQAEYWKSQFEDEIPALDMPLDYARPQIQSYEGASVSMLTDEEISSGIKNIAERTGATEYMIFLAALMVTLSKYSRQEDIVIGSPISGRTHRDTEGMLGMFVNTLAMRGRPEGNKTFEEFLNEIREISLNAYENQEYPFEELVEAVDVRRDMSRNPIFDVMLTMQNNEEANADLENVDMDRADAETESVAKFDMSYDVIAVGDRYAIALEYCTALFTKDTAERILSHFNEVLKSVIADSNQKINEIKMLTEEERRRIINDFNETAAEYPRDKTVVELLEEKAETMPERTAIKYDGTKVSFRELNERANRLGKELRSRGIGTNDFVLLIAERSSEMIEAIYGILKSGGAYVPVDANTPNERIKFILEDCGAKAAVTYGVSLTAETETEIIRYEDVKEKAPEAENPEIISGSRDLAYMIYTSGTTGQPKGVMIEHQGLVNLLGSYEKIYDMREDDAVLQFASYCFDQSVWDIFSIVWSGNAVCAIPSDYVRNPEKLSEYMEQEEITLTSLTPAYINVLEPEKFGGLRLLDSSGEAGNLETLKKWRNAGKRVINTYGPTEVTVNTSSYEVTENSEKLPIGKPISNTKVYILNGIHLCGIGVPGELCIAGDGVARGYLNRPELTAEKFVKNPYGDGKMYRSGDLARWLPDGNIEYLGRIDEQVKIRGFRIELGEIESRIREIENIKDCAVIAKTDASGDKAIYAYYTSEEEVSVSEIRGRLGEALPNYMIPAYMKQIEEIPVTRNGKLDRRALPEIEAQTGNEYAAPETETQAIICEIFGEILGAERVGIKDGFFELGGHSLRATRLANSIEEKTGVKIALRDIFVHATPEQLAEIVDNRAGEAYEPIPKAEEKEYYAMSSAQKRTYLIQQLEPESMAYNMPFIMKMTGEVYPEKLREALQKMIDRHEILRTAFLTVEGEPVQKILETAEAEFEYTESTESDEKLAEEYFRAFDLSKPPFVRVKLVNKGEYCLFMLDMHHIVSDGMSENIFISELTALYKGEELEPPTRQYRDYSEWMRTRDLSGQAEYWKSQFEDEIPALDMPLDYPRPQIQSYEGASVSMLTDEKVSSGIKNIAERTGATEYMIFLAALMVTLSKYSRQEDIVIGSPISGRTHRDTEGMLGMFVNTLAMRGRPEGNKTFEEFLNEIREISLNAYENQEYPFEELVEAVDVRRDMSRNPLFDVLMVMQNNEEANADLENVDLDAANAETETVAKFDMTFSILPLGDRFGMSLEYCTAIYRKETAERILSHFNEVLKAVTADRTQKLNKIEMLTEEERRRILNDFNETAAEFPRDRTVVELFEEQVEKTPDNIALVFENTRLTYAELNEKANALAHKLRELEVKPDDFVAIIADRSIEMITGIYGILKSGGAYVPIDPTYPEDRIRFMLEDCKPKAALKYTEESINIPEEIPVIDLRNNEVWEGASENPEHVNKPNDLIYCIYTSGTTGKPKGVLNRHKGIVNLINWMQSEYPLSETDVILQKTTYVFDVSVSEIFWWFKAGAKLAILKKNAEKEPEEIAAEIEKYGVTAIDFVPSMLSVFMTMPEKYIKQICSLKYVLAAGEALNAELVKIFYQTMKKYGSAAVLGNIYGPTEASVYSTYYNLAPDFDGETVLIGRPVANAQAYIVNNTKLCGIGVPGELCIAGDGVARGYLNRPELTTEKFVKNPYGDGKMYRSGDLARWLPDGNIEYLGRIDEQVKIRGFRIELGEIESKIREIENIKDCAVIARTDASGDKAIYAYYTSEEEVSVSEIRDRLGEALPNYMIPAYMTQIEKIPVTRNGKLDRRALPEIEARTGNEYAASETETQAIICEIFGEILGAERVGIKDGFFELGGHSLRATRLANSIEEKTGVKIALRDIFVHATPEQLAEIVDGRAGEAYEPIPKAEEKEYYAMSSAQKRTYLIQQLEPESMAYNMPFIMKMTGEVYPEKLREALQKMIDRHEILRTAFLTVEGEPVQKILETAEAEFEYTESTESDEKLAEEYFRAFDLSRPPFVRVKLVNKGEYCLFILDMHHIVSDGMSENIFVSELTALYRGEELEPLNRQYRDYSEWMRTRDLSGQAEYWKSQFEDEIPALDMPLDYARPQIQSYEGASVSMLTDEEISSGIKNIAERTGATEYMIFLAALMVTLSKYSRQEDIVIGSPISGRTHRDTEGMLGMFVNTLAMRGRPEGNKTFEEFLNEIREISLNAYENQEYPFEELVEAVDVRRDMSRNPIFDVMLTMQNNEEANADLENVDMDRADAETESVAKFDMSYDVIAVGDRYAIALEYCTALFTKDTAERILSHFNEVLKSVIADSNQKINEIKMLTEEERRRIINDFNETAAEYPRDKTVVELFEEQVERTPDNIALVFENTSLTYAELNARANSLGHKLRKLGVKPDDFVAIIADRSIEMIAGIYGIIKAGGAYVPVDPTYPEDRIRFMIEDCKPKAALKYTEESINIPEEIPVIDLRNKEVWEGAPENPEHVNKPNDLIYCIYTSGTTGKPKGVMLQNSSVVNYCSETDCSVMDYAYKNNLKSIVSVTNMVFDIFVTETHLALINGYKIILASSEEQTNPNKLNELLLKYEPEVMQTTPSRINLLFAGNSDLSGLSRLKYIMLGGEKVERRLVDILGKHTYAVIENVYGPTETTVWSSCCEIGKDDGCVSIGKPISNTQIYIVNNERLCGIGVSGELCIAGDGLARGYLNRPELTAEKFVKNPFGEGKMYRTGDLARWLPDGNIEYLGRIDEQVKIRGFRIELGEIESRIREIENIKDCAVIARTDASGDKAIYAYYTSEEEVSASEIRGRLGEALPNYMIPAYMTQIEEIPVTRNGKLDKRALPEIEARTGNAYAAPETETQKIICEIFCEILNAERVGIKDGFFELGGHSLRATRLANSIEEKTGVKIALRDIFVHATPEQLAEIVDNRAGEAYEPIPKAEEKEYYAMSSTQKRTYLIQQMEPESMAYNMPFIMKMTGEVYPEKLKEALQKMIDRHEILRTAFLTVEGEPVQKILETAEAEFEYTESTESDEKLAEEYFRAFDLSKPPFVRVKLVNKGEYCLFMLDMHHIVSDGMSENIFVSELTALYSGEELEPLTRQYRDYSEWMRTRDLSGQAEYWKSQFEDEIPALDMPLDYPRPQIQSYEGASVSMLTDEKVSSGIKNIAEKTGATEYMIFLAALMVTLSKYSRQEDIVIGSPISGRTHRDTEGMLGMFVNTLAMRGRPEGNKTFEEFLNEIREISLNAYENQEYPFEELVEAVDVRRDMSRNPLFDVLMVMQNNEEANADLENVDLDAANAETEAVAKFDMTFSILPLGDRFGMSLEYCTAIYRKETAERILSHFNEVLKAVTADRTQKLNKIEMLTEGERRRILNDLNDTAAEYPRDRTVVELFEEQVERTSDNTALVYENENLTYAELNAKANALAHKLRELEVKPDDFVAIIADKSIEMIAGIYGILKSGGAYVPIDPTYPEDRIRFMLEDCKPKAVLKYTEENITIPEEIPVIDLKNKEVWEGASENPEHINTPNDLIYCIYTSGTTGKPKGVILENKSVVNHLNVMREKFYSRDVQGDTPLFTSFAFDFTVPAIFGTLLYGDKLAVTKDAQELADYSEKNVLAVLKITPSYFNGIFDSFKNHKGQVKTIVFGGETLTSETIKNVRCAFGENITIFNEYGPTEATVFTSVAEVHDGELVTIGKPISNSQIYIMNETQLCGIGVPGELCIAGDGLARGYLNRPELTAEKFVKNPYGDGKMYHSGDLARWLPDGNIEYLGRIDEQVKIRGFRIELGEIENRIREIEKIKDCAVIARTDASGEKAICAYYTSEEEVSVSEIRDRLSEALPNYMIPAYMTQIEKIPVTRNGKLDKRALPEIETKTSNEYAAPQTETQTIICEVFSSVLGIEKIGINDGFFELGGNSLKALRILNLLRANNYRCSYQNIYTSKTVEELAYRIDNNALLNETNKDNLQEFDDDLRETISGLFDQFDLNFTNGNEMLRYKPLALGLDYFEEKNNICTSSLTVHADNVERVIDAIRKLIKEQDTLRSCYSNEKKEILVYNADDFDIPVYNGEIDPYFLFKVMGERLNSTVDKMILSFIIIQAAGNETYNICCLVHHALSDDYSKELLKERLLDILNNKVIENNYNYFDYVNEMSGEHYHGIDDFMSSDFCKEFNELKARQKAITAPYFRTENYTCYLVRKKLNLNEMSEYYENPLETIMSTIWDILKLQFKGMTDNSKIACSNLINFRNDRNRHTMGFFLDEAPFIYDNGKIIKYNGFVQNVLYSEFFDATDGSVGLNYAVIGDRLLEDENVCKVCHVDIDDAPYFKFVLYNNGFSLRIPDLSDSIDIEYLKEYFSITESKTIEYKRV